MDSNIKKEMCQCRKCNNVFHQSETKTIHNVVMDKLIEKKVCPYCGNKEYGLIYYNEKHSIEGVYKTDKFSRMK